MIDKALYLTILVMCINGVLLIGGPYYGLNFNNQGIFDWANPDIKEGVIDDAGASMSTSLQNEEDTITAGGPSNVQTPTAGQGWDFTLGLSSFTNFVYDGYLNAAKQIGVPQEIRFLIGIPVSAIQMVGIAFLSLQFLSGLLQVLKR